MEGVDTNCPLHTLCTWKTEKLQENDACSLVTTNVYLRSCAFRLCIQMESCRRMLQSEQTKTKILLRSYKLNIPPQKECSKVLVFNAIEEQFYRRLLDSCRAAATTALLPYRSQFDKKLADFDRQTIDRVLNPLLQLRKACCHPQIAQHGRHTFSINKKYLSQEDVLENMIQATVREANEQHRLLISSFNGLAGLHWLKEEWSKAAEEYRNVLRSCSELKDRVHTDRLQCIHALHNLAQLLTSHRRHIDRTCRDETLQEELSFLKKDYLKEPELVITKLKTDLYKAQEQLNEVKEELGDNRGWYVLIGEEAAAEGNDAELVRKVRDFVSDNMGVGDEAPFGGAHSFMNARTAQGLSLQINRKLEELEESRDAMMNSMRELLNTPLDSQQFLNSAVECHLRPEIKPLKTCRSCTAEVCIDLYESKLFSFREKQKDARALKVEADLAQQGLSYYEELRVGSRKDPQLVLALRTVQAYARMKRYDPFLIEAGKTHLSVFEGMRKEFDAFRQLWMAIDRHTAYRDEVAMAMERMRLATDVNRALLVAKKKKMKHEDVKLPANVLERVDLDRKMLEFEHDKVVYRNQLDRKLSSLSYLKNGGARHKDCPICLTQLGKTWALLNCAHLFCWECVEKITNRTSQQVKCATCRALTHKTNVSYVMIRESDQDYSDLEEDIQVKGSYSTKVEEVVRCLLSIRKRDATAKTLVFSTWQEILQIVALALRENHLPHILLQAGEKKELCFHTFRTDVEQNILLLPVHSGSKGLNLVEATNVILVEPILNPAAEQQALGRVHRIGQTKETTVYRFVIRNTIEERVGRLLASQAHSTQLLNDHDSPITFGQLAELFNIQ